MNHQPHEILSEEIASIFTEKDIPEISEEDQQPSVIGQPRGLKALQLGTRIGGKGYNIFVTGRPGTGRQTAIKKVLSEYVPSARILRDIAYVYNFKRPDSPNVLYFHPGKAKEFKRRLHLLIENLKKIIRGKLESESYKLKRNDLIGEAENHENSILADFEAKLLNDGFQVVQIDVDNHQETDLIPLVNGVQTSFEELQNMVSRNEMKQEEWNALRERYYLYIDNMKSVFQELRTYRESVEKKMDELRRRFIQEEIHLEIKRLLTAEDEKTKQYLADLENDILNHVYFFTDGKDRKDPSGHPALIRYGVNILEDNSEIVTVPIVYENFPSVKNMFGTIEYTFDKNGESRTSFMHIRAGSAIRASGGFLILRAEDLLQQEETWIQLLRVLETGTIEISTQEHPMGYLPMVLKPEPVAVDIKIIISGNEHLYDLLYNQHPEFSRHFKVCAEFDTVMPRTAETTAQYIQFMRKIIKGDKLRPISSSGITGIVTFGIRQAENRNKLTTRFSEIYDLLHESDFWAGELGKQEIDRETVNRALQERRYLNNLPEEKINEMIEQNDLLFQFDGEQVGKIIALAVHERGYYSFGSPCLVTSRISPGNDGIVNIEREVGLSGEIHDKWVFIIESFLRSRYARTFPLSVYASICFEQSYGEIDGDSASAAEVYALLSSIAEVPIKQSIAVTGSMNQWGEIQPIGGVNEKIEGFYNVCRMKGLTGSQGVIFPIQNKKNIILPDDLQRSIAAGEFHLFGISHIDQGILLLTGMRPGILTRRGQYSPGTFNAIIEEKLKSLAQKMKGFGS